MSTATYPAYYPRARAADRTESAPLLLRMLTFGIGLTLPIISLNRGQSITHDLLSRVETVDILCLMTLLVLTCTRRLRLSLPILLYMIVLFISLPIALGNRADLSSAVTAFAALMMAALYYVLGASVAPTPALVRALMIGAACGALGEGFIVLHDFLLPGSRWFEAKMENTVRGTFRSTAQLGNYGFATAGLLLSFGWAYFRRNSSRALIFGAGLMCAIAVLASSRRTGMFALAIWMGLYVLVGLRPKTKKGYFAVVIAIALTVAMLATFAGQSVWEHFFGRVQRAAEAVQSGDSFTHMQFQRAMDNFALWFPLGTGAGQDMQAVVPEYPMDAERTHEIHNGHLALLVELGVAGAIVFNWLVFGALFRRWGQAFGPMTSPVKLATITFMLAAAIFMVHARPQRDRSSMIFLGMVPLIGIASLQPRRPVMMYMRRQ